MEKQEMKEKVLRFRVSEKEHEKFMEQAKNNGFSTFSDYIRYLLDKDKHKGGTQEI